MNFQKKQQHRDSNSMTENLQLTKLLVFGLKDGKMRGSTDCRMFHKQ